LRACFAYAQFRDLRKLAVASARGDGDSLGWSIPIHNARSSKGASCAGPEPHECLFLESKLHQPGILPIPAACAFRLSDGWLL